MISLKELQDKGAISFLDRHLALTLGKLADNNSPDLEMCCALLSAEIRKGSLGMRIDKGEVLGTVTNPITNVRGEIIAPHKGRILGMAVNQVVQPGFAAYRIGIQQSEDEVTHPPLPDTPELDSPDLATSGHPDQSSTLPDRIRSE